MVVFMLAFVRVRSFCMYHSAAKVAEQLADTDGWERMMVLTYSDEREKLERSIVISSIA